MRNINTAPISGMQELLPEAQAVFNDLKTKISDTYKKHGFTEIETPAIERTEILLAKAGGDTEKQIYKVVKTAESADEADQALRFDHTVPLARYVIEHENDLTFPFKVSQIGPNYRGERAQKGRFREFYQCDIDIITRNDLPISYDADIIHTLSQTLKSFKIKTPFLARINNRKILTGLLEFLNLKEKSQDIYSIIDHSEKVPTEKTKANLEEIGLNDADVQKILTFIDLNGDYSSVIKELNNLNIENDLFNEGIKELEQVMQLLESTSIKDSITVDMKIIRGLDYYTGTVFEFILPEYKEVGSICGGGRYDNLTKFFSDKPFPGVGGSIGLTRLFYVLNEKDLLETKTTSLLDYAIVPISDAEYNYSFNLAEKIRNNNNTADVILIEKKLGDKMSYAAKIAKNVIVIGETETETNDLKVKNFETGQTTDFNL